MTVQLSHEFPCMLPYAFISLISWCICNTQAYCSHKSSLYLVVVGPLLLVCWCQWGRRGPGLSWRVRRKIVSSQTSLIGPHCLKNHSKFRAWTILFNQSYTTSLMKSMKSMNSTEIPKSRWGFYCIFYLADATLTLCRALVDMSENREDFTEAIHKLSRLLMADFSQNISTYG